MRQKFLKVHVEIKNINFSNEILWNLLQFLVFWLVSPFTRHAIYGLG